MDIFKSKYDQKKARLDPAESFCHYSEQYGTGDN